MVLFFINKCTLVCVSMEEAKKNMYAFSTTTYTGFQCTVSEETSEKFKGKKKYQAACLIESEFTIFFLKFYLGLHLL